ncbi:MAG TPA: hypothetical protein VMR33_17980 [Candidatus Baltobacteraceae bacterium]|jgi:hypothetical protein|nr:hypothetical protein [Candidatus Baltobacteraceae bacterium]
MSSNPNPLSAAPLDLSKWRNLPVILMVVGGIGAAVGAAVNIQQFAFSWLLAFMFCLSLCVGGWFLVMVHHLFDASWSVPTRRYCEHLACLLGIPMVLLFLPIAILAEKLYPWLRAPEQADPTHALHAKYPLFTAPGYYIAAAVMFGLWFLYSNRLRYWSLRQDETGSVECTHRMRFFSASGVVVFALTVTLAAIMWMSGLMIEWYSTMYGVCYFAASIWVTLPTVYVIALILQRTTVLRDLLKVKTYYMIGSLFFAFTVFWAYVNFAQYFIIWNANMPEETFWYNLRAVGSWDMVGKYVIIFGHFFIPFLMLLRIDWKLKLVTMVPLAGWAWLMHFADLEFQIMPSLHPNSILTPGLLVDIACVLFFVGVLMKVFIASLNRYPLYPLKDPRMAEAMDLYVPPHSDISIAPHRAK